MRIIFIEGVSGVGKTTMARTLCEKLRDNGFSTDCHLEFDYTNPVDFYCTAYFTQDEYANLLDKHNEFSKDIQNNTIVAGDIRLVRYYNQEKPLFPEPLLDMFRKHEFCWKPSNLVPISEYTRVYKSVWEQFAKIENKSLDYMIFDGSLFHHPINDMTRNYGASLDQVTYHISVLIEAVNQFRPRIVYLSSENVAERLHRARISRKEAPPSTGQIHFWEQRKRMDLAVMQHLSIPCDVFDVSQENWDSLMDEMVNRILETDDERRARIYPIILRDYNPAWPEWFAEEKANLERLLGDNIVRIQHIGSTAVPGLTAKPTVDILLEIHESTDIDKLIAALPPLDYICLRGAGLTVSTPPPHLRFIKGYLPDGFAEKVYHIHVVYAGDEDSRDKQSFRDYLIAHPEAAAEYAALKRSLFENFEHDRDGYTDAKGEFVKNILKKARTD